VDVQDGVSFKELTGLVQIKETDVMKIKTNSDLGLLILRLGIGLSFCYVYGYPKLMGGPGKWEQIGAVMSKIGVPCIPGFWGLMAALSECLGGALLIVGFGTRVSAGFMAFTMLMASVHHLTSGDPLYKAAHAMEMCAVLLALVCAGSGKYAVRPS
jgi:putative oxidoreductase